MKETNLPWSEKYRPERASEVIGQDEALGKLKKFILNFGRGREKAALLYGPSGTGKTCSVYAIAQEHDFEVLEVNASDFRSDEQLRATVGIASRQASLFGRKKIILVDEIEGITGSEDRGGLQELARIIESTNFPIVMTASFKESPQEVHWDSRFNAVRKSALLIRFYRLKNEDVLKIILKVARAEGLNIKMDSLLRIASMSGGDARAAINDLQTCSSDYNNLESFSSVAGDRLQEESMSSALIRVFKGTNLEIASAAFSRVNEDPDTQFLWVEENLPREYKLIEDLFRAYDALSKADVFRGRIVKRQYWGYLRTVELLMTAGVAAAKDAKYSGEPDFKEPKRALYEWIMNSRYAKRKSIAQKLALKTHCSTAEAVQLIPFISFIFRYGRKFSEQVSSELGLEEEEVEWLKSR
ncbi:MAG: replication factor C large subunit [Candidatus Woesearchaeota archaeon]